MRKTIKTMRELADKFKVVAGLLALLLAGALISAGTVSWNYESRIDSYDRQIARKDAEIDAERGQNRQMLASVAAELAKVASASGDNTQTLANIAEDLKNIAAGVSVASKTAKSAATTARSAAKSAAQPKITITEIRPGPALQAPRKRKTQEPGP